MSSWEMEQIRPSEMEATVVLARFPRTESSSWLLQECCCETTSNTFAALKPLLLELLSPAMALFSLSSSCALGP
eukprot:CAMPEP_0171777256 /NCGR_PEP_ID=MMETSP0991-20121206/57679_1 /TAXON_ID=483369 /ORGANISM="non described non described, Strain CCMP2098" /LENGTH=73 /DNA_ID=CAMNT_0012383947 /DNA_START=12 /DNA_END=230 /DNA_ORIENTATION=+